MALKLVPQTKAVCITYNLFCDIAAKKVEGRCCTFYQPRKKPCNLILLRDRFERQWKGAQLRYSTRFAVMLEKRLHDVCWAIPHLFERLFLVSWENNKDCHITMPLSLKTMEIQIKGDQWKKRFRACLHGGGEPQVGEVTRLGGVTLLSI